MNLGVREESKQKARRKRASLVRKRSCSEVRGNLEKNRPDLSAPDGEWNGGYLPRGFQHSHIGVKYRSHDGHRSRTMSIVPVPAPPPNGINSTIYHLISTTGAWLCIFMYFHFAISPRCCDKKSGIPHLKVSPNSRRTMAHH